MSFRVAGLAAVLCLAGQCASAQEAGGFTFRRIAAPPAGQAPKITVQIDPADYDAWMEGTGEETSQVPDELPPAAPVTEWDWFWEAVSPQIADTGPANTALALQTLAAKPAAPAPRLQALRDITGAHGRDILSATVGTDVSPALVVALIAVESSGRVSAESDAGALGLMQLIPDTAARFGVEDPTDPAQNIKGGVAYLAWLLEQFDRDPILALAGYNAGENAVKSHGGVPPFAETRAYVPKVLNAWRVARGLCMTPPELITDGCVFEILG